MFPRQLDEMARDRTQMLRSQAQQLSAPRHQRRHAIRRRTGWTLVMIGLRIAETASR